MDNPNQIPTAKDASKETSEIYKNKYSHSLGVVHTSIKRAIAKGQYETTISLPNCDLETYRYIKNVLIDKDYSVDLVTRLDLKFCVFILVGISLKYHLHIKWDKWKW